MDFADITYTIPRPNIFSGVEPCLAVALACVPMMRPLLGRSVYTPDGSGRMPVKAPKQSTGSKPPGSDGFQQLKDESSQLWLRPMGPKYNVGVAVQDRESQESLARETRLEEQTPPGSGGISMKQEWAVRG
jgi:hypothetical protein